MAGPIVWTLISEIYANLVRGRAISVATAVEWLSACVVAQFRSVEKIQGRRVVGGDKMPDDETA